MMGRCVLLWSGCGADIQGRVLMSVVSAQEWWHWLPTWSLLWALSSTKKAPPSHIWKAKLAQSLFTKPKLIPFRPLNPFSALLVQRLCTQANLALGKYSNFIFSYCSQVNTACFSHVLHQDQNILQALTCYTISHWHPLYLFLFLLPHPKFSQLIKIFNSLGPEKFPLVEQTFFPSHKQMVSTFASFWCQHGWGRSSECEFGTRDGSGNAGKSLNFT